MDRTHDLIRETIEAERVVFSIHADNQLATRDVERWQAVVGFADGRPWRRWDPLAAAGRRPDDRGSD